MTKRPGRPRLEALVTIRLPATQYDSLARAALRRELSLPEVIRRLIGKKISKLDKT